MKFVFPFIPVPKARPRVGKYGTYTPSKTRAFEDAIGVLARQQFVEPRPYSGPLGAYILFYLRRPNKPKHPIHPIVKPDLDNLIKSVFDALNGIVYNDDSQICRLTAVKMYETKAFKPCIILWIRQKN